MKSFTIAAVISFALLTSAAPHPQAPLPAGVLAAPANGGPAFDVNGQKNVGNGHGGQFITGQCLSNADCQSGCCALPSGICSGPGAADQAGKQGCGFVAPGSPAPAPSAVVDAAAAPTDTAAPAATTTATEAAPTSSALPAGVLAAPANGGPAFDVNGQKNVGNGHGGQFITGQCLSNADCQSGCCALPSGICSGPGAADQAGKQGCGFVAPAPPALLRS